jgi:hypothetical protein
MLNHARATTTKLTDWQPGSGARTLVEAPAIEMEELYIQAFNAVREAIPTSAYQAFSFDILPAAYARGFASVSITIPPSAPINIPAGTLFTSQDGRAYYSTVDTVWAAGQVSVRVPVQAEATGFFYNISEGGITSSPLFGVAYNVGNTAITTGKDIETEEERSTRFAEYIASLSAGTNDACIYAVKSSALYVNDEISEYVTRIGVVELSGYVRFYIYSSAGTPSQALIDEAQKILDGYVDENTNEVVPGYIAAGVHGSVLPMAEVGVDITLGVELLEGYTLDAGMEADLLDVYRSNLAAVLPDGKLYIAGLESDMIDVTGVAGVVINLNAVVSGEGVARSIKCPANSVLVDGEFTVEAIT